MEKQNGMTAAEAAKAFEKMGEAIDKYYKDHPEEYEKLLRKSESKIIRFLKWLDKVIKRFFDFITKDIKKALGIMRPQTFIKDFTDEQYELKIKDGFEQLEKELKELKELEKTKKEQSESENFLKNCLNCEQLKRGMGTEGQKTKTSYWDCEKNSDVSFKLEYLNKWGKWTANYDEGPENFTCDLWKKEKTRKMNDFNFRRITNCQSGPSRKGEIK